MKQYLELLQDILDNGEERSDRTGTGVLGDVGRTMRFNLAEGFPLVTTKKMFVAGVIDELLWIVSGSTNAFELPKRTQKWWTPWADEYGNLGPIYGELLRRANFWDAIKKRLIVTDPLQDVINSLRTDPYGRRHVINLWNSAAMKVANLPCCHGSVIQFYVARGKLTCSMYQRSCDIFIGLPVNIACYALLTHMVAQQCGLEVGELIWTGGDVHLYKNHIDQAMLQISREPMALPSLALNNRDSIDDYQFSDFQIVGYKSWPKIEAEVSV